MMVWPVWLGISSPVKLLLWVGNRLATWTGLFFLWKRWRESRFVWMWLIIVNAISFGGLCFLLFWFHVRHR